MALRRYSFHPAVESAEIVEPRRIAAKPNDLLRQQWPFHNTGQPMGWCCKAIGNCFPCSADKARLVLQGTAGADINAVAAWDLATGSSDIVVAVLDTGIDLDLPDLSEHLVPGWDFVHDTNVPDDDHGHGTEVSSIIGAVGNNGKGMTGLNWSVSLMPIKVCTLSGSCDSADIIAGIEFAVANGAHVINMSLGCDEHQDPNTLACNASNPGSCFSQAEEDVIRMASQAGVVVVEAAGNCGGDNDDSTTIYPCAHDVENNICAGSTDMHDQVSFFSNTGKQTVDIGAPGQNVVTYYPDPPGGYRRPNGTSFSTPMTAGVAALLMSRTPLSPLAVKIRIRRGGDRSGPAGATFFGGRLDAMRVLADIFLPGKLYSQEDPGDVTLLADVTRNGRVDLIRGIDGVGFEVARNSGKRRRFKPFKPWSSTPPATFVIAGDVDGNRRQDLILGEPGVGFQVLRARKKKFRPVETWSTENPGAFILAGDVDGDRRADVVRYTGTFDVLLSTGTGFAPAAAWSAEPLRDLADLADVNGDGMDDLLHWTDGTSNILVEVSFSTGSSFGTPATWRTDMPMRYMGAQDFNGDGRMDLLGFAPDTGCFQVMSGLVVIFSPSRAWICPDTPDLVFTGPAGKRKDGRSDLIAWTAGIGWELLESTR
jgi:hypothetical protein